MRKIKKKDIIGIVLLVLSLGLACEMLVWKCSQTEQIIAE